MDLPAFKKTVVSSTSELSLFPSSSSNWAESTLSSLDPLTGANPQAIDAHSSHSPTCNCDTCICRSALNAKRNAPIRPSTLSDSLWAQPGGKGQPFTLTYSYAPGFLDSIIGMRRGQVKASINRAFSIIAQYVPITFVEQLDRGPTTETVLKQLLPADANEPQLRFHFADLDRDRSIDILAEAYLPDNYSSNAGDIFFDDDWWNAGLFVETALHEIGHALGMKHVTGVDAIMNPVNGQRFKNIASADLLPYDIQTLRSAYGQGTGSVVSRKRKPIQLAGLRTNTVFLQQGTGMVRTLEIDGNGQTKGGATLRTANGLRAVATGDLNGNGVNDLILQRGTGSVRLWTMTENGAVSDSTLLGHSKGLHVRTAGDINGDGIDDLILQKGTGAVGVWTMDSSGKVKDWTPMRHAKGFEVVASGDFTGNGRDDIVLQRGTGSAGIWSTNRNGTIRNWTPIRTNTDGYRIVGAGNFAGSSADDLVLQLGTTQAAIWTMNGARNQGRIEISSIPTGFAIVA